MSKSIINRFLSSEMKNSHIRWIIFLGILSILGITFSQVYWVQKAVENNQEAFNHQVQMALRNVVESLCEIDGNDIANDPIDQISNNYFVARTNYKINLESLDYLLKAELEKKSITEDFEFGVYDCTTDRMVYGDFISMSEAPVTTPRNEIPILGDDEYYFGVYFPGKLSGFGNEMQFWKFTTAITAILTLFFGYTLFIILRQKRLSEIQRDFINNMTHEFKTPLSTLRLSMEALEDENLSNRGKKYLEIIGAECERLQNHVTRLLGTNSNTKGYDFENIDVGEICKNAFDTFDASNKKGWSIKIPNQKIMIFGHHEILEMVVLNLLDNAQKYGKSMVHLAVKSSQKSVFIEITNNGEAISKKDQRYIFQKFYRISQGDAHDVKGFGLGLAIVKKSVKILKGSIKVESTNEQTTFTAKFPKK